MAEPTTEVLLAFSRIASRDNDPTAIPSALAKAAVAHSPADAAIVVRVAHDGELTVAASQALPPCADDWRIDAEAIDEELGADILHLAGEDFDSVRVIPLMSHHALFGALVLLFTTSPNDAALEIPSALADLAAISLGTSLSYQKLENAFADLRESREAAARAETLRALGQMAAGVAHDLKNILNPISIHMQLLARLIPEDNADAHESIDEVKGVIRRGVETIDRLREFSRTKPRAGTEVAVYLILITREAVEMARARLVTKHAKRIALTTELGDAPRVCVTSTELVSAIVNLVVNAIDALVEQEGAESKGHIVVTAGLDGNRGFVRVEDDGPGIADDVFKRIFEPFFSTKGAEGTGLGLANVYAFARRHGGDVTVSSSPGKGATFTILLPVSDGD